MDKEKAAASIACDHRDPVLRIVHFFFHFDFHFPFWHFSILRAQRRWIACRPRTSVCSVKKRTKRAGERVSVPAAWLGWLLGLNGSVDLPKKAMASGDALPGMRDRELSSTTRHPLSVFYRAYFCSCPLIFLSYLFRCRPGSRQTDSRATTGWIVPS